MHEQVMVPLGVFTGYLGNKLLEGEDRYRGSGGRSRERLGV